MNNFNKNIDLFKQSFLQYQTNCSKESFEKYQYETNEEALKRGEKYLQQLNQNQNYVDDLLNYKHKFLDFFLQLDEDKKKLIEEKNDLINELIRLKKEILNREEWIKYKKELDKQRVENEEEKLKRINEELKEEIDAKMKEMEREKEILKQQKEEFEKDKEKYFEKLESQKKQLEDWTGLKYGEVIFDSNKDNWSKDTSVFDDKIKGKRQLLFIIEDDHCEKFGYYLNTEVKNEYNKGYFMDTDIKSFEFNVESNGRMKSMMKFDIKDTNRGYWLNDKSNDILMLLGDIVLRKENKKSLSFCEQREDKYDYQGIPEALCGRTVYFENGERKGEYFTPLRITVIQMK